MADQHNPREPERQADQDSEVGQDAEPTMNAPPEDRPGARSSGWDAGGRAASPDAADTDEADAGTPQP